MLSTASNDATRPSDLLDKETIERELNELLRRKIGRGLLVHNGYLYVDLQDIEQLARRLQYANNEDRKEEEEMLRTVLQPAGPAEG